MCGTSASADRLLVVHEARVAADELVERFLRLPVAKAMNLGTRAGFDRAVALLAAQLRRATGRADVDAVREAIAVLDVDWARTTAAVGTSGLSPGTPRRPPVWVMGAAWALLPCGLLYSALLVAAMSGNAWRGAIVMASFSVGSGLWLAAGPWVLGRLRTWRGDGLGIRLGGACLVLVSATALWLALMHDQAPWCVTR